MTNRLVIFAVLLLAPLVSCHNRRSHYVGPSIAGLRFHAAAATIGPAEDTLAVTVTARNNSDRVVNIEFSRCLQVSPITAVAAWKGRRWNSRTWELRRLEQAKARVAGGVEQVCAGGVLVGSFPPGGAHIFSLSVPVSDILGDSLNAGTYNVTAALDINGRHVSNLRAGDIEISLCSPPNER